jgi:hypothetical protein
MESAATLNIHLERFGLGETESLYPESYVSFELEPRGDDVLLVLTHLPVLERFENQNAMGGHTFLDMLGSIVAGRVGRSTGGVYAA